MTKNAVAKSHTLYEWPNGRMYSRPYAGVYDTSFPLTENPISEGGIWLNGGVGGTMPYGNVQTVAGKAMADRYIGLDDGYPDSQAILDPAQLPFEADQWAEVTVYHDPTYEPTSSHEVIIILRGSVDLDGPNHFPMYHCLFSLTGFQLFYLEGAMGVNDEIIPTTHNGGLDGLLTGDVLRGEVEGTALRFYQKRSVILGGTGEFVLRYSATDSSLAAGQPGPCFFVREEDGQDYSKFCITRFRCGSL